MTPAPAATPPLGPRFRDALVFASEIHALDYKKGTTIPYVSHVLAVCALVLEDGGDEDEAIAALLHDSLEDHPETVSRALLAERFGPRVAELVELCTDTPPDYAGGPKPPWKERKLAYLARLQGEPYLRCRVSLADKLHNARAIVLDHRRIGDRVWERFTAGRTGQLWYLRSLVGTFPY